MRIGAQLFTVRDFCKTTADFAETLKKIAAIGYRYVQVSGTCPYEAAWLKEELNKNGLSCVITHNPEEQLLGKTAEVAKNHDVFGCRCIGLGYHSFGTPPTKENYDGFVKAFLPVGEQIAGAGHYFMYHNHDFEFAKIDGKCILDRLAEDFPPEALGFTLDTFWVQAGGGDPGYYLEKLAGRVPCIHLKDYAFGRKMAVVGEGNLNFSRIFRKAEAAGTQYMLVEQDDCNGEDPFACLERSFDYLRSNGFE